VIIITSCSIYSQKILLKKNVEKDSVIPKWGPNRNHYVSLVIGIAGIAGKSDKRARIEYGKSSEFTFGIIYKRKINNHYAAGFRLTYEADNYRLKPNSFFSDSGSIKHDKEKQIFNSISMSLYNRINFDKRRGNYPGHYLDLGIYGSWFYSVKYYTKDKINGKVIKTTVSHMDYPEKTGYGVNAQLGFNRIIFYTKYRISDLFNKKDYPELPRITAGVLLGLNN
jgi:hypothetical protein